MRYFENMTGATSSPSTKELTAALSKAQSEFPTIAYDRTNEHLRSKYATFQGCCAALRAPLTSNGFALPHYQPCIIDGQWVLLGVLRHVSGEFVAGTVPLLNHPQVRIDRKTGEVTETPPNMQGMGAAMTYAKRQLLLALTGAWVGEDDEDGEDSKPQAAVQPDHARSVVDGMVLESRAMTAIERGKDDADKAMAYVKLQVHQGKAPKSVYERLASVYSKKWGAS